MSMWNHFFNNKIIMPKESRNYGFLLEDVMKDNFKYGYKPEDLWEAAKKKKVIKYNMNDVKHWVYGPCWSKGDCFISIYQVLMQPKKFPEHISRIKKADTKYPLIVIEDKYDKYGGILDGNHRFAKMVLQNKKKIPIVYFTKDELNKLKIKL